MAAAVKPSPRVSYRQQQALATRERIARSARRLFGEHGYAATSVEVIAADAGVAPRTVYAAFANKKNILAAVCETWLEESGVKEVFAEGMDAASPEARIAKIAEAARRQWEVGTDVLAIIQGAAAADADIERMLLGWSAARQDAVRRIIAGIGPGLAAGVTLKTALELATALGTPAVYLELKRAGWSASRYQAWLTVTLEQQLLGKRPRNRRVGK